MKHTHMPVFISSIPLGLGSCSDGSPTHVSDYGVSYGFAETDKGIEEVVNRGSNEHIADKERKINERVSAVECEACPKSPRELVER